MGCNRRQRGEHEVGRARAVRKVVGEVASLIPLSSNGLSTVWEEVREKSVEEVSRFKTSCFALGLVSAR